MNRRALAGGVLLVWLGAIGWLVRRELWRPQADLLAEAALSLPPGARYFAITLGDEQVGYASSMVDTLADTLRFTDIVIVEAPVSDTLHRTEARTEVTLTRTLRLRDFRATVRGDGTRFVAGGRVEGDSVLVLILETASSSESRRLPLSGPLILPQLLPLTVALGGDLRVGRSFTRSVFDPVLLERRDVAIAVAAESTFVVADSAVFDERAGRFVPIAYDTVRAWELRHTAGMPLRTWVDDDGIPVLATSPVGLRIERSTFETAYENFRRSAGRQRVAAAAASPLVRQTAIADGVSPSGTPTAFLRVRLGNQDLAGLDLDGGRQRLRRDTLEVRRERAGALEGPYRIPAGHVALRPYLAPEPLMQSDDPRVQAQARQIVGRTQRPRRAAELLTEWVYQNVSKTAAVSVPSALEVLSTRRGDCNEHTALFVALARAVGLPARTAAGLVRVDGRFYYHAWAEVYLNGWVAVDPTFGQFPADATHLRFRHDGLARQLEMVRLVGQLTFEVLETEP